MTYEELIAENQFLRKRIRELELENARLREGSVPVLTEPTPQYGKKRSLLTDEQKEAELQRRVNLFRSLFRGREDVFARRFIPKSGKPGYQPECRNRWSAGCRDHRFRCEGCLLRDLVPLDNDIIRAHLHKDAGEKDVIGLYPILEDNTCFFLCADFDDKNCTHGYREDVLSYVRVCREWGLPVYIERSRSGNGAHVWVFFEEPIAASKARKLGFSVLSAAMESNARVDMKSYDRFFPNQDMLPKGGFGNLVALPMQGLAKKMGNSLFVDDAFQAIPDQWTYLAQVRKLTGEEVSGILSQHCIQQELSSSSDSNPWETPKPERITFEDFHSPVKIVKANGLYLSLSSISGKVIRHLKGIAAFRNPKYYELQNARKPLYHTPSLVSRSEMMDEYLFLPRGCEDAVIELIQRNFSNWEIDDQTNRGRPIDVTFNGTLRTEQEVAIQRMLAYNNGVLAATTAFGKTVTAIGMIARKKVNTLILVPSKSLLHQWKSEIERFLIINEAGSVGMIDGTKNTLSGMIDIAVFNSALTKDDVKPFVRNYGMVIADECHHSAAIGYERVLQYADARYVYGLSATPTREDGMTPIIFMQCGPIRYRVDAKAQMAKQSFDRVLIPRFTSFRALEEKSALQYLSDLALDRARNELIVEDVVMALQEGRCPIILTKRTNHVNILADMLAPHCRNVIRLIGTASVKEKRQTMERLKEIPADEPLAIVATGKYVGEGFNYPRLDTLFIALPVAYSNIVQQYTGRLHREFEGKREVRVYDYIDIHVPVLANMYGKRIKSYAPIGYSQQESEVLQTNPKNIVYGKADYLAALVEDVQAARSSVVIACDSLQYMKGALAKALQALGNRGVDCCLVTRKDCARDVEFANTGIRIVQQKGKCVRAAVIDRTLLWFGSIDLAGSAHREDDNVMRIVAPKVASEMLGIILE